MIGARTRDYRVPDDSLVGGVGAALHRPLRRDVDEQLFRVPREERRQVRVQRELDYRILLLSFRVVVGSTADDLDVLGHDGARGAALVEDVGDGDEAAQDEGDGCEEAEDGLDAGEGAVHDGLGVQFARAAEMASATCRVLVSSFVLGLVWLVIRRLRYMSFRLLLFRLLLRIKTTPLSSCSLLQCNVRADGL